MIREARKQLVKIFLAVIAMTAAMLTPNSVDIGGYPVSQHHVTSGCSPAPHENFGLIELKVEFKVASRPNEFAVIFATDRNFSLATAITIDKYGNIFVSLRSAYSSDTYKYAVLLSAPIPINSKHAVEIDFHIDKRINIKFDGKNTPLVDVNNGNAINTREIKTEISEICINQFGSKNFNGAAFVDLQQFEKPIQIQLPFFRVMLLLFALGFALLAVKGLSDDETDLD